MPEAGRTVMICGKTVPPLEASDHYMACLECDELHRARKFVLP